MRRYTIKYVGFDLSQQEAISAILDLAESALTDTWLVTDDPDSDIAMINLDASDGQQLLTAELQLRPAYRIILVAEHNGMEIDTCWFLAKKHQAPPSLRELNTLLNEIAIVLAEAAQAALTAPTSPENNGENIEPEVLPDVAEDNSQPEPAINIGPEALPDVAEDNSQPEPAINIGPEALPDVAEDNSQPEPAINIGPETLPDVDEDDSQPEPVKNTVPLTRPLYPRNYFFGLLLQAKKDSACRVIKRNKQTSLYLSPSENSYYFTGSAADLLAYCTASPQYLEETVVTKQRLAKILKSGKELNAQPLDELLVYAIIEVSQGRLLEGHFPEQAFKLTQLPDVNKTPTLVNYKKIAEFMHKQPGNLFEVAEALQIPLSTIFEFYNACYLLGYLTVETATKIESAPIEPKKTGKLSNFLKTLREGKIF
ncbi:MAG: hypothetical protein PHR16_06550 [Methylovulum sp.]|nr:hypothetical protein [Methylovulum sp.]